MTTRKKYLIALKTMGFNMNRMKYRRTESLLKYLQEHTEAFLLQERLGKMPSEITDDHRLLGLLGLSNW
jgi:hypothetical protein